MWKVVECLPRSVSCHRRAELKTMGHKLDRVTLFSTVEKRRVCLFQFMFHTRIALSPFVKLNPLVKFNPFVKLSRIIIQMIVSNLIIWAYFDEEPHIG